MHLIAPSVTARSHRGSTSYHVAARRDLAFFIETDLSHRGDLSEESGARPAEVSRVLIADADPDVLRQANRALRGAGFDVAAAGDATQAKALLETQRFDLLFLDAAM